MNALILGLDVSSSAIGYVLRGGAVHQCGVIRLDGRADISERCVAARCAVEDLLLRNPVDAVAIESPVARFAKAVIPQARISGVVLCVIAQHALAWCEITPTAAKLALAEDGAASKEQMLRAAAPHFGYEADALSYRAHRGEWGAWQGDVCAYSEHHADALGICIAAAARVTIVEAAA